MRSFQIYSNVSFSKIKQRNDFWVNCSFIHSFNEYDRKEGVVHLCDERFQKAANVELGQNLKGFSSLVTKWWPQGQAGQEVLPITFHLELPWTTIEGVGSKPKPAPTGVTLILFLLFCLFLFVVFLLFFSSSNILFICCVDTAECLRVLEVK